MKEPPAPRLRDLKAAAQLLKPQLIVGRSGVNPAFVTALDAALRDHELVKVRFGDFKAERRALASHLAELTGSRLVLRVGHVAVFYRARPSSSGAPAQPLSD